MYKKFLILCMTAGIFMTAGATHTYAQQEAAVKYDKSEATGFIMPMEAEKTNVENSLEDYFKNTFGSKSSSSKGYRVFKAVSWPEVSTEKLDVYYKVEGKKGKSQVSMLVSKGYDNFIGGQNDAQAAQAVKNFLANLNVKVNEYTKNVAVAASAKEHEEAQKEYNKYIKKAEDLNKEKARLEKEIADNQSRLVEREKELNKAKANLDAAQAAK